MFTGIVEETGSVLAFEPKAEAWSLTVAARAALADLTLGDSIAVNGCCLTVAQFDAGSFRFDVLEETRRLTHFSALKPGAAVNLERSLRFGGKVGGHFVTGHIDTVGTVATFEPRGKDHYLRVRVAPPLMRHVVHKGSIAIDGMSLTVAEVAGDSARGVAHSARRLRFDQHPRRSRAGERVNLEFDLLGKYVEKLLEYSPKLT